jgi:hypothetical protein
LHIFGIDRISEHLEALRIELERQRSINGDGYYIDPDTGEVC